ncbi:MAG: hypothetical protein ACFB51_11375 [Anaerolineae bacterium]
MTTDTITIRLHGENIPLADFAYATQRFEKILAALTKDILGDKVTVEWQIVELMTGSTVLSARGVSAMPRQVARVTEAFVEAGLAVEERRAFPSSARIEELMAELTEVINGHVESIEIKAGDVSAHISETFDVSAELADSVYSMGTVRGVVEAVNRRQRNLSLTDHLFGRDVKCEFSKSAPVEDFDREVRDLLGRTAAITGTVEHDRDTGRPVKVHDVVEVQVVAPPPEWFDILSLRGILGPAADGETAEDTIRRLRDEA